MKRTTPFLFVALAMLMLLSGCRKRLSILGDSYSTFEGCLIPDTNLSWYPPENPENPNDVKELEQTWWQLLMQKEKLVLEVNNSYSGATVCNMDADHTESSFLTRMKNLGNPDVIIVFGATNDAWLSAPIGEYQYADWSDADLMSFRPAMAKMCDYLKRHHPSAHICFVLNSELGEEISSSVLTITAHYAIPCVVLHDIDKIWEHPSTAGMMAIAEQVAEAI